MMLDEACQKLKMAKTHEITIYRYLRAGASSPCNRPPAHTNDAREGLRIWSFPKPSKLTIQRFFTIRALPALKTPKRNTQDTRTGPRISEILPTPEVARTSQIPKNPENDIRKTPFPPKLRRIPATSTKNVHRTTGAILTHHSQKRPPHAGKTSLSAYPIPPLPEKRSPRTRKGCKLQKPSRSESASNIVFYDGS